MKHKLMYYEYSNTILTQIILLNFKMFLTRIKYGWTKLGRPSENIRLCIAYLSWVKHHGSDRDEICFKLSLRFIKKRLILLSYHGKYSTIYGYINWAGISIPNTRTVIWPISVRAYIEKLTENDNPEQTFISTSLVNR